MHLPGKKCKGEGVGGEKGRRKKGRVRRGKK